MLNRVCVSLCRVRQRSHLREYIDQKIGQIIINTSLLIAHIMENNILDPTRSSPIVKRKDDRKMHSK